MCISLAVGGHGLEVWPLGEMPFVAAKVLIND